MGNHPALTSNPDPPCTASFPLARSVIPVYVWLSVAGWAGQLSSLGFRAISYDPAFNPETSPWPRRLAYCQFYRRRPWRSRVGERRRILRAAFATVLGPSRVAVCAGLVDAVRTHGNSGMASLASIRFQRRIRRPEPLRRSTHRQLAMDLVVLRVASRSAIADRDHCSVAADCRHHLWFLAPASTRRTAIGALSGLGEFRLGTHVFLMAVEFPGSWLKVARPNPFFKVDRLSQNVARQLSQSAHFH